MREPHPGDSISVGDHYYILASTFTADLPKLVLKHDEAFFVADRRGDLPDFPHSEFGFYVGGTRFLSRFDLRIHGQRPLLLNAAVSDDNLQVAIDLTNADVHDGDTVVVGGRMLHLARRLALYGRELFQTLRIESFSTEAVRIGLDWRFGSDFADVFEVRGLRRARRGCLGPPVVEGGAVRLLYRGLDGVERTSVLTFDPAPGELTATKAAYELAMPAGGRFEISAVVTTMDGHAEATPRLRMPEIVRRRQAENTQRQGQVARIVTAHEGLNGWLRRSRDDIHMLITETPDGSIPYAGIPWYVAPFGRDSLIAAHQMLPFEPQIALGTLRFLARYQGTRDDAFTDQAAGRILHELRRGEMAACREIPFLPYYGSVDATPLFVMLLAEYLRWTGDYALIETLWPNLAMSLAWLGAGRDRLYLSYVSQSPTGLGNQGWKDSHDAIMHESGELASAPIALVEAQGYKYAALLGAAEIFEALGRGDAATLRDQARQLRTAFEADFWQEGGGYYALALDGSASPCRVISSNPAHGLWTGIVDDQRGESVARRLMAEDMFSGWGLRTLSTTAKLYNPMSYHNGSVWPHDTAIAAAGFKRYGRTEEFLALTTALFDAALEWEGARMPELFCGFPRSPGLGPTRYPVACSPQAWAAGVPFQLLSAMLGLSPDARENRLSLVEPVLPPWLNWIEIRDLRLGSSTLDFAVSRGSQTVAVELLSRRGDAELIVRR